LAISRSLEQAQSVQRFDIADPLKQEIAIVQEFLPKALSLEETKRIVVQAFAESGAKTKKE